MVSNITNKWHDWLVFQALPLWDSVGFNKKNRLYAERLTFKGVPIDTINRRLMVQARQIATYCQAQLNGQYNGGDHALEAIDHVEQLYYQRDGEKGWIFSIAPDNTIADKKRDLYGHAFILYAYGWAFKLSSNQSYIEKAKQIIYDIEDIFSLGDGFLDAVPGTKDIRSQNPHMHLLEAFLTLFEMTQDEFFLHKVEKILKLAFSFFIPKGGNYLLEFFNESWHPLQPDGENYVEPGHQAEWCWLLGEYNRIIVQGKYQEITLKMQQYLFTSLKKSGFLEGNIIPNVIDENNSIINGKSRVWPQTEMLRFIQQYSLFSLNKKESIITRITDYFFEFYIPPYLNGGWYDCLDEKYNPIIDHMPASTLYHIYNSIISLL